MILPEFPPLPRKEVDALGIKTSYYAAGAVEAAPVVLLHGMSASADSFRELMYGLSDEHRLVAPDIPGFGYSGDLEPYSFPRLVQWLCEFFNAAKVGKAHVVGHSFGGALSVTFALNHPECVRSLIMLAPSILRPGKYPDWIRNLAKSQVSQRILELGVNASRIMLERQVRAAFYQPDRFPPSLWERRTIDYELSRASAAVLRASALHDFRSDLAQIEQPTAIIWGKNDPVLDPAEAEEISALMPRSETTIHLFDECGHVVQVEQQKASVQAVSAFLTKVDEKEEG